MLYLIDITKLNILELKNDITKIIKLVNKKIKTNFFKGKLSQSFLISDLSNFLQIYQVTNIVKNNISISFHIQTTLRKDPSHHKANVTNVCKKNCNNNNHKNHFIISSKLFFIRLYIAYNIRLTN